MSTSGLGILQRAYIKKKKDFRGFSLRWMSARLGISHVYLSQMIKGTRPLSVAIVEPLCEILDLDTEARAKLFQQAFKDKGYRPLSESKKSRLQAQRDWSLAPAKDLDLLNRWEALAVLQTTLIKTYDGSAGFIAKRLSLPEHMVKSILILLEVKGYVQEKKGKLVATEDFYEFQSLSSKDQIRSYHKSVMDKAKTVLEKTDAESVEERLITSAAFTCSREDVMRLKSKIAEFLKELVEESASSEADSVYQLGMQFFPLDKAEKTP